MLPWKTWLISGGLLVTVSLYSYLKINNLETRYQVLISDLKSSQVAYENLRVELEATEAALTERTIAYVKISKNMEDSLNKLKTLKAASNELQDYLDTPVPDDVRMLIGDIPSP